MGAERRTHAANGAEEAFAKGRPLSFGVRETVEQRATERAEEANDPMSSFLVVVLDEALDKTLRALLRWVRGVPRESFFSVHL